MMGPHGYMLRVVDDSMHNLGGIYSFASGAVLFVNPDKDPMPGGRGAMA